MLGRTGGLSSAGGRGAAAFCARCRHLILQSCKLGRHMRGALRSVLGTFLQELGDEDGKCRRGLRAPFGDQRYRSMEMLRSNLLRVVATERWQAREHLVHQYAQ